MTGKKVASIAHVSPGMQGKLMAMVTAFASNPAAMDLWRELEQCRVQAEAADVTDGLRTCGPTN